MRDTLGPLLNKYTFSQEQKDMIKGSCDFFAIDGYTGYLSKTISNVTACISNSSHGNFPECAGSSSSDPKGFPLGPPGDNDVNWLYSTPVGIRRFLNVITKELYPSVVDIMVTEFGFAEPYEGQGTSLSNILWDLRRADYYQGFLDNILAALHYDGMYKLLSLFCRKLISMNNRCECYRSFWMVNIRQL